MKNITLWIPAAEQPRWACVESWWNLRTPYSSKLRLVRSGANNVRYSWNQVIKNFLETSDEWILSIHNDVVVAPETLLRLLSWDKPLISALVFMRTGPALPHIWKSYDDDETGRMVMRINDTRSWLYAHPDWIQRGAYVIEPCPEDALVPIDFSSTSCTLIHRSVLEAMRPIVNDLWFEWDDDYNGGGEDRKFFTNAKVAGFDAYVDRSCMVGHLTGDIPVSAYDFVAWDSISTWNDTGEPAIEKANGA